MRQVYFNHLSVKHAAPADQYLQDDLVRPGYVLDAHRTSAYFDGIQTTEVIRWFIKVGNDYLWLADDKPATTGGPCQRDVEIHLGEGMALGVYAPDLTTGEVLHFIITGCLYDLESWRQLKGL